MFHWHVIAIALAIILFAIGAFAHFAIGMASNGSFPEERRKANLYLLAGAVVSIVVWVT